MKRIVLAVVVVGVVAAWPAASGAATFKGVVVGKEHGSLLVASPSGLVRAVAGRATVGARVVVAGARAHVVGRAHTARLHGVVVSRTSSTVFLSSNRHLLALHHHRGTASPAKPGAIVSTQVSIAGGQLDEDDDDIDDLGQAGATQVQALVTAVAPGSVTVSVNGKPLTLELPAGLTLPASLVGQMVTIQVRFDDDNEAADDNDAADNDDNDEADDDAATTSPTVTSVVGNGDDHGGDNSGPGGDNSGHGGGDDGGGHH